MILNWVCLDLSWPFQDVFFSQDTLDQGSQTRGPQAPSGPRVFMWPAVLSNLKSDIILSQIGIMFFFSICGPRNMFFCVCCPQRIWGWWDPWPFLKCVVFFEAVETVSKIGSSLKPNQHSQVRSSLWAVL